MTTRSINEHVRYEPDEGCPPLLAVGVGAQGILLALAPTVLVVAVTVRAMGQDDAHMAWALFGALMINAAVTALHAVRIWRFGSGQIVITAPTVQFVVIMVAASSEGGPGTLASLLVVSAFVQFALAMWLPLLRRIITPVVSGIVLMLVGAAVLPVAIDRLSELPPGAHPVAGPGIAFLTLAVALALALRASGSLRVWSPLVSSGRQRADGRARPV